MIKILTPAQPAPVMEIARELLPPGMELIVAEPGKPEFYDAAADAEYYLGSPRMGIGNEFFRAAPKENQERLIRALGGQPVNGDGAGDPSGPMNREEIEELVRKVVRQELARLATS